MIGLVAPGNPNENPILGTTLLILAAAMLAASFVVKSVCPRPWARGIMRSAGGKPIFWRWS
jgi:hypothetical protein